MPNSRIFSEQFGAPLNPGTLRHQVTYQRRTVTGQDTFGADVVTWGDLLTCRAQVMSLTGRELVAATQIWAEARYKVTQHYTPGIKPSDRISWYVDGEVRLLDVLDVGEPGGLGAKQIIFAKDHVE